MLLRRIRHVQILPLLCAVCCLTLAFPTQMPSAYDDVQSLQVNIPHSGLILAPLGSSISIPCLVPSTPTTPFSSPIVPRVKWTVVSGGVETQILVARGERVKVNEAYRDRAALLNYTSSPDDLSLWLEDLRPSDSGHYRCEVQQGLEDASDIMQLKVKGVVFHYRDALGRYAFSFHQAQRACQAIGAEIATAYQLLAAYYDGYEQCDAGWLADQSVRYPIQVPREGCYGDMNGQPGVRNYGTMDPDDLFDVYCYVEQIDGEVFHDSIPQQLSFDEAQTYCRAAGAQLATTAQLYLAWSEGLDRCSPGWLSDGSVRYPIITPRERCGGPQAGVKTLYRFSNQTGFPEPSSLHDVYCFKDNGNAPTDSTMDYVATEPEDIEQNVVILTEADQELRLNQHTEQVEREVQSVVESFPFVSHPSTEEHLVDTNPTVESDTTESPLSTVPTLDLLQPFYNTSTPTEINSYPQHPTALMNTSISSTETYDFPQNTSLLPSIYNDTDSHQNLNSTFHQIELESTTGLPEPSYEPHTHNQTAPDINPEDHTQPSERPKGSQEVHETKLDLDRPQANYSETDSIHIQEKTMLQSTPITPDNVLQVKLEEAAVEGPGQMSFSTQVPIEEGELLIQSTQAPTKKLTSLWPPLDASGDNSQESDLDIEAVSFISTTNASTSGFTTSPSPSASASSSAEHWTALPDPTSSSWSQNNDKLGLSVLSTVAQIWDSPISRQEGSTSLDTEDTVTMESEGKQHTTNAEEILFSGISLAITEPPAGSNTSNLSTDFITARYQTSGYSLDTATTTYEEASGQEPGKINVILREDVKVHATLEEDVTVSHILNEEIKTSQTIEEQPEVSFSLEQEVTIAPTLKEQANVTPTFEEAKVAPTLEEETNITSSLEEPNVVPTLEEEANFSPPLKEEAHVASGLEEEATIVSTLKEQANIASTGEEEASITTILEEETNITSSLKEPNGVPTLEEEVNVSPTLKEEANVASGLEEEATIVSTLKEEANIALNLEEEASITTILEEETNITSSLEEPNIVPTLEEEEANVSPPIEEEANVSPPIEEEANVSPPIEEEANVSPPLEEEAHVASALEEETTIVSTLNEEVNIVSTLEEEANITTILVEEANTAPTFEEEASITPTLEGEANITPTFEEEANTAPTFEGTYVAPTLDETNVAPNLEDEANVSSPLEEETDIALALEKEVTVASNLEGESSVVSALEEEPNLAPTVAEDFTIFPLDSLTSNWALPKTTTGPQESLNDLESSKKTSPINPTVASDSSSSTKPTVATTKMTTANITTTTQWFKRTWSPTTSTPGPFHKTTEPQEVTHPIQPVDQGLVDVEFGLTQPPTLLVLPNERAAVGGTGKASDACADDPCLNGGTCIDRDGHIKCLCLPTYGGDFCQTDLERCEPGWDKFHGFCYRHFSQRLSWEVAEQHCRMLGAHLVSIMTPEEQIYINSNYKEYQWTGLNDKTIEDDFRWSDGNPLLYENWYRGQPDSYFLSGEDCVVMVWHDDGRWSDVPCNYHLAYTCKKGTSSCGPPPKVRNASIFGKARQRYETNAVVRYRCAEGFQQRLNPLIRCLSGGVWDRPQILCIPEAGVPTQHPEVTSPTNNFVENEDDFEATKEVPQYWDIKF